MTIKLKLFIIVSILVLLSSCHGQTTHQQVNSDKSIGKTVSELGKNIMVIYQANNDDYWFGSWDSGVYRFNGQSIINYTTKHGLANNRIDEIKEDASGNIYFTSCHPNSTICKFNGKSFRTLSATPSDDWQLKSTDLWFKHAYQKEKVYRYDGSTLFELDLAKPPNLTNNFEIYCIYNDSKGNVWFGTNPVGVCRYNGQTFDWITEEDVTEFRNEAANGVRSMLEDKDGLFWFNTEQRYSIYDSLTINNDSFYTRYKGIGSLDGEKDGQLDEFLSTLRDKDDNLWFVTYLDGVWKYDGSKISHYTIRENFKQIALFSIYKDKDDTLWLGTHENGVYKFNGKNFEPFTK